MSKEALKLALEALEWITQQRTGGMIQRKATEATTAIKQALEQPVQEPVAIREAVMAEREACAKVCESKPWSSSIDWWRQATKREVSERSALECANSIRARGNA